MKTCGKCNERRRCKEFGIYGPTSNYAERCKKFVAEFKPCPFCGAIPEYRINYPTGNLCCVSCENEECKIHPYATAKTRQELVKKWNHRV